MLMKKIKKELYMCIGDIMVDLSEKEGLVFESIFEKKMKSAKVIPTAKIIILSIKNLFSMNL